MSTLPLILISSHLYIYSNFIQVSKQLYRNKQESLRLLCPFSINLTLSLTFSIIYWHGNLSVKAKNALSRIVKDSSKMLGTEQSSHTDLYNRQVVRKANYYIGQWSSHVLLSLSFTF